MNYYSGLISGVVATLLLAGTAFVVWKVAGTPAAKVAKAAAPAPPAKVSRTAKEDDFTTLTLTKQAETRLGIRTAAVERKAVPRVRVLGGEILVPPGRTLIVAAPLNGTLRAAEGGMPAAGATVKHGQTLVLLDPLLTPEAKATLAASAVEAEGQVKSAQTQVEASEIALNRSRKLLSGGAGAQRDVDEKKEKHDLARRALEAATARRDLLTRVVGDLEKGTATPLRVCAPEDGMLRSVSALPGQCVPSGATLFEVIDPARVWVRLGVYVGDLPDLAPKAEVRVGNLADLPGAAARRARPVQAPPSANPLAATVDLFYELDNKDGRLCPGQRVGVHVPLKSEETNLVVPWSAVIHDIHGGTWVYENPKAQVYTRRRVVVRHVAGDLAVLAAGPAVGTKVVTQGAAELFGTEVGFAK
jgi:RND family efflux transporter MFP subunit